MSEVAYYEGLLDVYVAMMTTEDTPTAAPVYADPEILGSSIEVTVTPVYREGKQKASNVTTRNEKRIDTYGVKFNSDKLIEAVKRKVLGRTVDANGVQKIVGSAKPPLCAIGFAQTLDDGSKELWWLYKGNFAEVTQTAKTEGDNIEYQTETLEGTFVRRKNDDTLAAIVDTADEGVAASVETSWFTKVYETTTSGT